MAALASEPRCRLHHRRCSNFYKTNFGAPTHLTWRASWIQDFARHPGCLGGWARETEGRCSAKTGKGALASVIRSPRSAQFPPSTSVCRLLSIQSRLQSCSASWIVVGGSFASANTSNIREQTRLHVFAVQQVALANISLIWVGVRRRDHPVTGPSLKEIFTNRPPQEGAPPDPNSKASRTIWRLFVLRNTVSSDR